MAKNKMEDLRTHLFDTIEQLKSGNMKVDTAQAISDVGRTILESAKVEMAYMKMTDAGRSSSALLSEVAATAQAQLPASTADDPNSPVKVIGTRYGKAQGVYYELRDGDVFPVSLETITETLGSSGLKLVPHYMSFTDLKKKLIH